MSELPKYKSHSKEYIKAYNATKVLCQYCGKYVQRSYLRQHERRKICHNYRNPEQIPVKPKLKVKDDNQEQKEEVKDKPSKEYKRIEIKDDIQDSKISSILIYVK